MRRELRSSGSLALLTRRSSRSFPALHPLPSWGRVCAGALAFAVLAGACASSDSLPRSDTSRQETSATTEVRLMSFNIRYGLADDGPNSWSNRRELVFDVIRQGRHDVVGLQEALPFQVQEIVAALPEFAVHYRTREADPEQGEACAVLYRTSRWRLGPESGTLWLSETPDEPGTKSWDSSLPRIVTWVSLTERTTGRPLVVLNTHFDHRGSLARRESAELVWRQAVNLAGDAPVVVMGDFNADEDSEPLRILRRSDPKLELVDTYRQVHPDAVDVGTFNSWRGETKGAKIDGILVDARSKVLRAEIVRHSVDRRYPSDHFPVTAALEF